MINQNFKALFIRDLDSLKEEIGHYPNDVLLWKVVPGIKNSGGTLGLHLCGNLQHFIGSVLGDTGYVRDRDAEFNTRDLSGTDLIQLIDKTQQDVSKTLDKLTDEDMSNIFPINVFGQEMTVEYFIIHLYGHLSYHLGQINYHRRITSE